MKIVYGIIDGMVMQRGNDNTCHIKIMILHQGDIQVSMGKLTLLEKFPESNLYLFQGIPVGGPYTITFSDEENSVTFHELYVGDVWLAAGQSNMEGCAHFTQEDCSITLNQAIRGLYPNGEYLPAIPALQRNMTKEDFLNAADPSHPCSEILDEGGVGPAYYFMLEIYRHTGIPQGCICYAVGGSPLYCWNYSAKAPFSDLSFYGRTLRRIQKCGGNLSGMFWYHGCSMAQRPHCNRTFTQDMRDFIAALRRDTQTELPIVQVQICRYITYDDAWEDMDYWWTLTREKQRLLGTVIPKLDTVSAIAAQTLDGIHICSADQRRVAKNAAESMLHLKGYSNMLAAPALDFIRINQNDNTIQVAFKNLHGALQAQGIPWGFSFSRSEHILTNRPPYRTVLQGNSAILYHDEKPETLENLYLTYAFGNTFYANITDSKERSIPGFGPIPLRFLKQK